MGYLETGGRKQQMSKVNVQCILGTILSVEKKIRRSWLRLEITVPRENA